MRSWFIGALGTAALIVGGGAVFGADFNGDGTNDAGIFRASTGLWSVAGLTRFYLGSASDRAVPGDYNGDGTVEGAIWRSGDGLWSVRNVTRLYLGLGYDDPLPGVLGNRGGSGGDYWQAGGDPGEISYLGGKVGIGIANPTNKLHIESGDCFSALRIVNTCEGEGDGISIEINTETPVSDHRFVSFWRWYNVLAGSIAGNGSGGVTYWSASADFAEFMPRQNAEEAMEPGDIVGVFGGRIAKSTAEAEQLLVVSAAPIVLGNDPGPRGRNLCEKVALLGQAAAKVEGPVRAGDYILPSGRGDGIGVAVSSDQITLSQCGRIAGRAVESNDLPDVKLVNAAVGINVSAPIVEKLGQEKDNRIEALSRRLEAVEEKLSRMQSGK